MTDSLPNLPRVDVVVPCYNYGRFLQDCIESVLTQSGVRVRILIIDDCSTDDTPEVGRQLVAQDSRVSYRRHEINCGHIATYNVGLDWVQSELFVLLSADDMLVEGALQRVADVFEKNPKVVLVYGDAIKFYGEKPNLILSDLGASVDVRRGRDFVAQVCRECANPIASPAAAVVRTGTQKVVGDTLQVCRIVVI
ncbi:MAG: glycosyltransferase family 2 protein [Candidatus Competibacteraceae bacterium]|nr:glycosyltransferase family 2 protein [Candidatus Competibacteraceae bacterium]